MSIKVYYYSLLGLSKAELQHRANFPGALKLCHGFPIQKKGHVSLHFYSSDYHLCYTKPLSMILCVSHNSCFKHSTYTLLQARCSHPAGGGSREVFVYKLTLHRFHSILLLLHQALSVALNDLPQSYQPFLHLLLSFSCKVVAVLVYCLQLKGVAAHFGTLNKQTRDLHYILLSNPEQYLPHSSPLGRHPELRYHKIRGRHPP